MASRGIIYEYEDGGKYCGEWENDAAHGHGVCTGPDGNGLFEGLWERGNQASGVFTWPSGQKYMGKWRQGVREGVGKETKKDGTEYCGEFVRDSRGPYGVLRQPNGVVYRGTWSEGVQYGEGTELYIDGGMYRGEYRSGLRHGHGTRSSSSYEQSTTKDSHSLHSSVDDSVENLASTLEDPSSNSASMAFTNQTNSQIYEGEWRDDKRHGYGVLKIVGHHTYYGQWKDNMRSGYGVMIYGEEKRKEEGQWQRGKLVQELKRKKLSLKTRQLEAKVNQAHMCALQAAETARNKADLAEGRASTANAKSRQAVRAAQQAAKDAEVAQGIEKLHRNAPKIQEHIKSPLTRSFSIEQGRQDPNKSSNLLMPHNIPVTPSFEDLPSLASSTVSTKNTENSSGSSESVEENLTAKDMEQISQPPLRSYENPSPELWKRKQLDLKAKRKAFQSMRHSSVDLRLHHNKESDVDEDRISLNAATTADVREERRRFPMKVHQSDVTFRSPPVTHTKRGQSRKRTSGGATIPETASEGDLALNGGGSGLRPRHINKATGEPDHGEATDEEESPTVKFKPVPEKHHAPQSVSVEVLQQMAHWNRMVAYLNLGLLFFLVLLIVAVIICMNYYWIVYQMSHSQTAGPAPTYLSGPMA